MSDPPDETRKRTGERRPSARRPSLLLYYQGPPQIVPLVRGVPIVVGRTDAADIAIEDPELSRRHARFEWTGDAVTVEDLGSTNGTFAHGKRVEKMVFGHRDEVLLGSVTVCLHSLAQNATEARPDLVIASPAMQLLHEEAARVAKTDVPVLLTGETGVGKDVVAQSIHATSPRFRKRLCAINCGAIASTLIHSQLFGHERGAFTGADRRSEGLFEQANGGTVFLDEVGELPLEAQAALLRVLESHTVTRVGSQDLVPVDVRVIAATNRDLLAMCAEKAFRLDLLFRLNTVSLRVPPLRERPEEIPLLAEHFLAIARKRHGSHISGFSAAALADLCGRSWPGNIRELRNVVERASIVAKATTIQVADLSRGMTSRPELDKSPRKPESVPDSNLKDRVRHYEKELILEALRRHQFNQSEAARELRVPVRTLAHKIKVLDLKRLFPK